jgi:hypothetical protein
MVHSSFAAESAGRFQAVIYEESDGQVVWSCQHEDHHTELSALNCAGREWHHRSQFHEADSEHQSAEQT